MKKLLVVFIILVITTGSGILWWGNGMLSVNPQDKSQKIFVVKKGTSIRELSNLLKKENLIRDPIVFFLLVKKLGLDQKIQAGDFRLSPSQNAEEIAKNLTVGILDIWVTVPEGKRALEIADILKEKIPSYQTSWRSMLEQNEGYLFPDTYLIPKDASIETVLSLMKGNFEKKYVTLQYTSQLSKEEIVIIASLIEREAKTNGEKPVISGIIQNRLKDGIALQIDATIQYAKGYDTLGKTWWSMVTQDEYQSIKSPYNTYLKAGLPPTPIANPGLEALKSAGSPSQTPYYFYLHDKNGVIHYAKTNEEHIENVRKYIVQ